MRNSDIRFHDGSRFEFGLGEREGDGNDGELMLRSLVEALLNRGWEDVLGSVVVLDLRKMVCTLCVIWSLWFKVQSAH